MPIIFPEGENINNMKGLTVSFDAKKVFTLEHTGSNEIFIKKKQKKETWPLKKIFHVRIQAAIIGFQTFYWSERTAEPQLIQ